MKHYVDVEILDRRQMGSYYLIYVYLREAQYGFLT
jgi:hypothetical protein